MFKDSPVYTKLLITGFILVLSTLVFFLLWAVLAIPFFDVNFFSNPNVIVPGELENINISKFFQIVISIGLFIIPPFVLAWLFSGRYAAYLHVSRYPNMFLSLIIVLSIFTIIPLIDLTAVFNSNLILPDSLSWLEEWMQDNEAKAGELTVAFLEMNNLSDFIINIVLIAMLPAIGEELLFRGIVQRIFVDWIKNPHVAIFITAFIFSAFHFQFYGFLPRMLIGIYLGYLLVWSNNLWYPIIAHFVNNVTIVIYLYFSKLDTAEVISGQTGEGFSLLIVLVGVILFILLNLFVYRKLKPTSQKIGIS